MSGEKDVTQDDAMQDDGSGSSSTNGQQEAQQQAAQPQAGHSEQPAREVTGGSAGTDILETLLEPAVRSALLKAFGTYVLIGIGLFTVGLFAGLIASSDTYAIAVSAMAIGLGPVLAVFTGRNIAEADVDMLVGLGGAVVINAIGYFGLMSFSFIAVTVLEPSYFADFWTGLVGGFLGAPIVAGLAAASFLLAKYA